MTIHKDKSLLRVFTEFGVFLTLFYFLDSLVFKEFYGGIFHLSLLAVAEFLELEVLSHSEGIALYTQMYFAPLGGKAGFVIDNSILSQMELILFKLPILLALVFTFAKSIKVIALSLLAIVTLEFSVAFFYALDMVLVAGESNKIIASYLTHQGVFGLAEIVATFKIFLAGYVQKFFAFGLAFYLFERSGVRLVDLKLELTKPLMVREVAR